MVEHTILQLSDVHFGAVAGAAVHAVNPDERLDAVLAACDSELDRVDLVVVSGDLTDDFSPEAYERLAVSLERLNKPTIALAGNHDDPGLLADYFDAPTVHELGPWQILCLDTSRPDQVHGTIDVAAAASALERLDGPVLMTMHHPPVSPSTKHTFSLDHAQEFLALVNESPQVKAIISGHLHQPFERMLPGGVPVLGCPSTLTGVVHQGDTYRSGDDAVTGARVVELNLDGSVSSRLVLI